MADCNESTTGRMTSCESEQRTFLSCSRGLCRECGKIVEVSYVALGDEVYLERFCEQHGTSRALVAESLAFYLDSLETDPGSSRPCRVLAPPSRNCPDSCGPCSRHAQACNLPVFSITNVCDLRCPICFTYNRADARYFMSEAEFIRQIDFVVQSTGGVDLINITGGMDMTLFEVDQAANRIREEVDPEAQIKVGSTLGEALDGRIRVSVIATGIDAAVQQRPASATATRVRPAVAPAPIKTQPQTQTAYAQPAYPAPFQAHTQQAREQQATPASATQTNYFTMPQAIVPHADVLPHAAMAETAEAEEGVEDISPSPNSERDYEKEQAAHPPTVEVAAERVEHVQASPMPRAKNFPETNRSARPASPLAPGDMRITHAPGNAASHQPAVDQRRQRRAESLFTRITGFGLVRPSSSAHHEEESHDAQSGDDNLTEPHIDVRPSDRPVLSEQPEDLLEIPAFLRRQSNH